MKQLYLKNVATLEVHTDLCTGCGRCIDVCPHEVLFLEEKITIVDKNLCMECGACMVNCPFDAITVKKGVGCSTAIIKGWINKTEPNCDCGGSPSDCC